MSETVEGRVNEVAEALQSVGYNAEARLKLGVVNVFEPADASKMYERADNAVRGLIDVRMTTSEKFQIDPDPKNCFEEMSA